MYCELTPGCTNDKENKHTKGCGSCNAAARKASKVKVKVVAPVKKVSPQMAKKLVEYNVKRDKHLKDNPECQIKLTGCEIEGSEVHHVEPRATGLNKEESFLTTCRNCHSILHDVLSASERREKGLLK